MRDPSVIRLYIRNIPLECKSKDMLDFFNQQMHHRGLSQTSENPILLCQINLDKNFAFIEFRSIDETTAGMAFDGINFMGKKLKVRRPSQIFDMNTLFISVPKVCSSDEVEGHLRSFGPLKVFTLHVDSQGNSKGYAIFEYYDSVITDQAIAGLNGKFFKSTESISICHFAKNATEVLCLRNMLTEDDLRFEDDYEEIFEDVKVECSKYGIVRSLEIPRPYQEHWVPGVSKVFVEFGSTSDCLHAVANLYGRRFANRNVYFSYLDLNLYHSQF